MLPYQAKQLIGNGCSIVLDHIDPAGPRTFDSKRKLKRYCKANKLTSSLIW